MGQIMIMSKQIQANRRIELAENARIQSVSTVDAIYKTFGKEHEYLNEFIAENLSDGSEEREIPASQNTDRLMTEFEVEKTESLDTDSWETID